MQTVQHCEFQQTFEMTLNVHWNINFQRRTCSTKPLKSFIKRRGYFCCKPVNTAREQISNNDRDLTKNSLLLKRTFHKTNHNESSHVRPTAENRKQNTPITAQRKQNKV